MGFAEVTGLVLDGVTYLIIGAVLPGPALEHVTWQIALYAVVSLTIVRMLPVAIALFGTHARPATVAFMGWFGPRGLALIVFAVILEDAHLPNGAALITTACLTVGVSVLDHGLSAAPLVARYVAWFHSASDVSPPPHGVGARLRASTTDMGRFRASPSEGALNATVPPGHTYGMGGEVAIWMTATMSIRPPRTTRPSRILKKRKCPLIPIRNRIVAR